MSGQHADAQAVWREGLTHAPDSDKIRSAIERLQANSTMNEAQAWPAPAKLNLLLRVVGRRPDGYHLLQTVFQFIDLCDELYFDFRSDGECAAQRGARPGGGR